MEFNNNSDDDNQSDLKQKTKLLCSRLLGFPEQSEEAQISVHRITEQACVGNLLQIRFHAGNSWIHVWMSTEGNANYQKSLQTRNSRKQSKLSPSL